MKRNKLIVTIAVSLFSAAAIVFSISCNKNTAQTSSNNDSFVVTDEESYAAWSQVFGVTSLKRDGDYWVVTSNDLPNHKSVYYQNTPWQDSMYAPYNNPDFKSNNVSIQSQNLTFRIPAKPKAATVHQATPGGPIGIALNGVSFFNQYNGMGQKLTTEIYSFDQYNGHCAPVMHDYHYHVEPTYLTQTKGSNALLGFLLDGFPVYGPLENGKTITNADLDVYHGHVSKTKEYPNGIYHYHITSTDPYINGNGFYGTPGTVSH